MKLSKVFHVLPPSSALYPSDKPQTVVITFRSEKEMEIKDLSILKCQVYTHTMPTSAFGIHVIFLWTTCTRSLLLVIVYNNSHIVKVTL